MQTAARVVLISAALLAGCHRKAVNPRPAPPPPPPEAVMATPPPVAAAMPPPAPIPAKRAPQAPLMEADGPVIMTGTRTTGEHHRAAKRSPANGGSASIAPVRHASGQGARTSATAPSASAPLPTASQAVPPDQNDAQQVHTWYQGLPNGFVRYTAPTPMILGNHYTASAYIPAVGTSLDAPATDPKTARTIDKNIKVSPYMRVSLAAPANADTFTIESPAQDCKFVSLDGATRWDFSVTPIRSGTNKTLTFTTTVLYGDASSACDKTNPRTIDVTTDTETVQVQALNAKDTGEKLKDDAIQNPGKWAGYLKYVLPGGAVFTFIAGIVAWWKKRTAAKPAP